MKNEKCLSFIIPCYNSATTISLVVDEIKNELAKLGVSSYEIVLVNDCSLDNSFEVIKQLCSEDKHIKSVSLSRNFGQQAAVMAGIRNATGDILVFSDDDGQTDVSDLSKLLSALDDDCDIVFGAYIKKKHSLFRRIVSRINAIMAELLIGMPKGFSIAPFYACKKYVAEEVARYSGAYPYILGLFLRVTTKIKNVPVNHRERISGKSNYTLRKMISLWLNGFTAFSVKPLRIATIMGFLTAAIGFIYGAYIIINRLLNPYVPLGFSSTMAAMLFIGGMIMIMLGLIGEYVGRIYMNINNAPQYIIRERIGFEDAYDKQ